MLKVALIGRPNVGKSTLFNRLVGQQQALVDDLPGVTRDRREGEATLGDLSFVVTDTAGIEHVARTPNAEDAQTTHNSQIQTLAAINQADLILLIVDGRAGIVGEDQSIARQVRKASKPVIVVVNKCEGRGPFLGLDEAPKLGWETVVPVSAQHGDGLTELYVVLQPYISEDALDDDSNSRKALQLAIMGRPNAGKSTLANALLNEERVITSPIAGTTRDAIRIHWQYRDTQIDLIDTAGIRARRSAMDRLEQLAVADSLKALKYAEVAVLVVDAEHPLEQQDLHIASRIVEEGRALIIAINKCDLIPNQAALAEEMRYRLDTSLSQAYDVPIVFISATQKRHLNKLMDRVLQIYKLWNHRVPTSLLNRWLASTMASHPPPLGKNKRPIRIKYMTQIKTRPPTFALFASQSGDLPASYLRYLENSLRKAANLPGVPLRLLLRQIKNPYSTK
jgi:GTP-binding protein